MLLTAVYTLVLAFIYAFLPCSGDLFHYLKHLPGGGLPEEEGAALFSQILAGVGYAHNQHICHRDLKLENILLSKYVIFLDTRTLLSLTFSMHGWCC